MTADPSTADALIIADGGLGGLVAAWCERIRRGARPAPPPRAGSVLWVPPDAPSPQARRRHAADRQASLCGFALVAGSDQTRIDPAPRTGGPGGFPPASLAMTSLLVAAAFDAAILGLRRVVWPVHAGGPEPDLDVLADRCDRALLIGEAVGLDAPGMRIELPYADFSDAELMDVALDTDAPVDACWWCERDAPVACGGCGECRRWAAALAAVDPAGGLDPARLGVTIPGRPAPKPA